MDFTFRLYLSVYRAFNRRQVWSIFKQREIRCSLFFFLQHSFHCNGARVSAPSVVIAIALSACRSFTPDFFSLNNWEIDLPERESVCVCVCRSRSQFKKYNHHHPQGMLRFVADERHPVLVALFLRTDEEGQPPSLLRIPLFSALCASPFRKSCQIPFHATQINYPQCSAKFSEGFR